MKNTLTRLAFTTVLAGLFAAPAFAQTETDPGHPRISQVDQRLSDQQNRIDAGVADGQINAKQAVRDDNRDARVQSQLSRDESKHGGKITKKEQKKLNRELNRNSKHIHHQRTAAPATPTPASR